MPQYRIEISPNNRAGCKDTFCKKTAVKITKGEIRFGTWVEIEGRGSWSWKHWGCVSGDQMLRLREECDKGANEWDFDQIDGYDELGSNTEVQEKIRRCVKQAHIDAEDFKGDPEKNKPGEKGIRLSLKQKAELEKAAALADKADDEDDEPKTKKRGRETKAKGRAKKAQAEDSEDEDDVEEAVRPVKKAKAPTKKASKVKAEGEGGAAEAEAAPVKKAKAATKKAAAVAGRKVKAAKVEVEGDDESDGPPAKRSKATPKVTATADSTPAKRGRKPNPVQEESEEEKPKPKRRGRPSKA
ncbi:hypothetical protein NQ176_g8009 [Zarea fungicola]|uniref:Uncharacterized protein n=1 Tax=Zarea fungicola TaxID=93591 RepID=A0ACC1MUW9_9HYPO|nr:hypothetical protein NQ176_g8009 [Lecanicillium fungicola]